MKERRKDVFEGCPKRKVEDAGAPTAWKLRKRDLLLGPQAPWMKKGKNLEKSTSTSTSVRKDIKRGDERDCNQADGGIGQVRVYALERNT